MKKKIQQNLDSLCRKWPRRSSKERCKAKGVGLSSEYMLSQYSRVRFSVTPWTVAHQAPLSMGFSRQEHWSGLPCPPQGILTKH